MIANVGFRLSALQAGNKAQRAILRHALSVVLGDDGGDDNELLGRGARYETAGAQEWLIFCDTGFELVDIARLGTLCAGLPNVTEAWLVGKTRQDIKDAAISYVQANIIWPAVVPEGEVDPPAYVLSLQTGVPTWVRASSQIPSGLTPKVSP